MASVKLSEPWNGIQRTNGAYHVESCYSVYYDPEREGSKYSICMNGFSIYTDTQEDLLPLLPVVIEIQIGSGTARTFTSDQIVRTNQYSPCGNLMRYAVTVTSMEEMELPAAAGTFNIHVNITMADETTFAFNETGYRPVDYVITPPPGMATGSVYNFNLNQAAMTGAMFVNSAYLRFAPQIDNITMMTMTDYGYVDPYTKVSDASSPFSTIQFAVANPGYLSEYISGTITGTAYIAFKTRYLSADFLNGILITDASTQVQLTLREGVDDELKPNLTDGLVTITGTNAYNVGHPAYVHRQSTLTLTPTAQFKYGDSMAYIRSGDKNTFSSSITVAATGVEPGTTYTRPDTGATVTAGEETVGSTSISVCGRKWGLLSDTVTKTYYVLWYLTPRVNLLSVHRAVRVSTSTSYYQNGYYYKKDDFGQYCIVEYDVEYASLSGQNVKKLTMFYGASSRVIDISSSQSGYYIFSAGDSATDVALELTDNFYPYGILATVRLSTAGILLDYLSGGKGMAVGKTATERMALDIAKDWKLLFYQADVGAYNDDTTSVDLVNWMHDVDARLTALESD